MKRRLTGFAALLALVAMPVVAAAHNAGHIILPDGTCLEIGSFHDAPIVGQDRTQLDLAPETPNPPFDEIGVSFVGHVGRTPILPGPCRVPPMSSTASQSSIKDGSTQRPQSDVELRGPFHSSTKRTRRSRGSAGY